MVESLGKMGRISVCGAARHAAFAIAAPLLTLALAGCGTLSPGRMYDRVADVFTRPADSGQAYPNLASVPPRPAPPSVVERQQVSAGLVADRNNAQYSEQVLRNPQAPLPLPPPGLADQPVTGAPLQPLPPADANLPQGAPVVRLVNGQLVATPGFFGTQPPPNSAPPAVAAAVAPAPAIADTRVAAAQPTPDVIPEAPPPPPFDLPPRPATPALAATAQRLPAPAAPAGTAMAALPPPQLVPPLQSAVSPARPSRASPQTSGAIAVIYFADGKSALDADGRKVLGQVTQLWRLQGGNIRVLGYSGQPGRGGDLVRTAMSSLGLASARADAVAGGLAELGVPREAIESSASNDPPPMIDQGRNTGVAGTRRVEIWLDY